MIWLAGVALAASCQPAAPKSSAEAPAMNSSSPPAAPGSRFEDDVAFLSQHGAVRVLHGSGGGRIAVSGNYQARVMTSAVAPGAKSLGFINRAFIEAGQTGTPFDNYGGEDRFWLGPEGGQYGLYFPAARPFTFDHWQTPHPLQEGAWQAVRESESSVTFQHSFSLDNYERQAFQVAIERTVSVLSPEQASQRLGMPLPASLSWVGYVTENKLSNAGSSAWSEQRGLLSVWILGMFAPIAGTQVIIPFDAAASGEVVNDRYFGKVPAERLRVDTSKGFLTFRADGQYRSKIGLGPARAKGALGSYSEPAQLLTLVLYNKQRGATRFVNSMWEQQANPYAGDEINSYNDGPPAPGKPPLGGFYEIESSSPAAALAPGESITHVQETYHFSGPRPALDALARHVLGVSLDDLPRE